MKMIGRLSCLLSALFFLVTARAEETTAAPTPAATSSSVTSQDALDMPVDPAKDAEIRKLLERMGTVKLTKQIMEQMIAQFRMRNHGISGEFWDRFEQEMNVQELVDKVVPIYAKYYTMDDLKAINAFYSTPVGQKMLASTPQIMQESMRVGQDWGRLVATRLLMELKAEKEKEKASETPPTPSPKPSTTPSTTPAPAPATAPAPASAT